MAMEEKLVINELEQGRDLAKRLISNLKHTSSIESSKIMISEILRIYQNAILMLSFKEDDKNIPKRNREIEDMDSKNMSKKRKFSDKKTEEVKVFVGTDSLDDGYSWRKYGQKEIHGSSNPRGYFRCTHRYTQKCPAQKQVQRSDKDPSVFEVKYVGNHTCNNNSTSPTTKATSFSLSMFEKGKRVDIITEKQEDVIKPTKTEEVIVSLDDLEYKKEIFKTYSFSTNHETENFCGWNLAPTTPSGSGITSEFVTTGPAATVEDWGTVDSCFSSLENIIDLGQDLWS